MPLQPSSYRQITVAGFPVGLTGLDEIFQLLRQAGRALEDSTGAELLRLVGEQNYIPPAAEGDYRAAILQEYETYCELESAGKPAKKRESWQGFPREQVPWFPTVDETSCDGCDKCLEFCSHGVFAKREDGTVFVAGPYDCVVGCDACARLCRHKAITFPPRMTLMLMAHGK